MTTQDEVELVKAAWDKSPYYEDAEKWTYLFWDENTEFRRQFNKLNLTNVVELACGYGRHGVRVAPMAKKLTLLDIFEDNLDICRNRCASYGNVTCLLGSGTGFSPIASNSVTSIYCYDAMVHFSMGMMISYLRDSSRILRNHGMALYHHSNYSGPALDHYGLHPHARNIQVFSEFESEANDAGLQVIESKIIDWGGVKELDRLTLLEKAV